MGDGIYLLLDHSGRARGSAAPGGQACGDKAGDKMDPTAK